MASRPGTEIWLAQHARGPVLVRLDSRTDPQDRNELEVLACLEHPRLARLVDHGSLAGGGRYLARAWVEGVDLAQWLGDGQERDPREVGRVIARLCQPLDVLHRAGFVHADLKPQNVVVGANLQVTLTDFGLAGRAGRARAEISGSAFALAPEVLRGEAFDPRGDLFALGVLIVQCFGGLRRGAREFYGSFPLHDFFRAAGSSVADLPEWIADLAARLVERDPNARPSSAAEVGRTLCARLGERELARAFDVEFDRPRFGARRGRESLLSDWSRAFAALDGRAWVQVRPGEDAAAVARELRVLASLDGANVFGQLPERGATQAEVESWLAQQLERSEHAPRLSILAPGENAPSHRRAIESLARGLPSRNALVVVSSEQPPAAELNWERRTLEPLAREVVEAWVDEWLVAEEATARRQFAAALHAASGGLSSKLERAAERALRCGLVLAGARLRPGLVPSASELGDPESLDLCTLDEPERAILGLLILARGRLALADALALTQRDPARLRTALAVLERRGLCAIVSQAGLPRIELCGPLEPGLMDIGERRRLAAFLRDALEHDAADALAILTWSYVAGSAGAREFADALALARDQGSPEAAIACADDARRVLAECFDGAPCCELALAFAQVGELERALELAQWLAGSANDSDRAASERIQGRVCLQRHEPGPALEHFDRAASLFADDGGEALLASVQLEAQLGRDANVLALAGRARGPARIEARIAQAIEVFAAMSWLRCGEIDRARSILEAQREHAHSTNDALREAPLCMNLGTLERRAGNLPRALEHFEAADALAKRTRAVNVSAQVLGSFAGLMRDLGELQIAEHKALEAIALRQRLGDHGGVQVARGVLALTLFERGHVARAATECALAAQSLGRSGRRQDAWLLEATAQECRARMGAGIARENPGEWQRAGEGDPRLLLSRARACAFAGDMDAATPLALRALALATSLGLELVRIQARDWLAIAEHPREAPREAESLDHPLAKLDLELQRLLSREPFDVAQAQALAAELERRGRDDRLARVLIAIAARAPDIDARRLAAERASSALARCTLGAPEAASKELAKNLLAHPDPWPEDLVLARAAESEEQEDEMEVLRLLEINHRLLGQPNLSALLGEIVDCALSVSGAERGFLVLEKDGELEFDTALDSRRGDIPAPEVEISRSILADALANMRPLRVSNAAADPAHAHAASVIALDLRSVLCAPFRIDKEGGGVIYVDHRLKSGAFTERAERMLALLADQAALAIQQVRRLEQIRRLNRRLNQRVAETESALITSKRALAAAGLPAAASGLVGNSPAMREVHRRIELAAQTRLPVLLLGPSGSGKELAARALHAQSNRAEDPFVSESCAALPAALIESELFGSRRGAFTGAERDRAGLFERADHGTLFLDEVGELPLELQAKLLRVLETGEVRPLGANESVSVDFRLVTATNRDLAREVREGRFRADLFYRLEGLRIELPSLAQRTEDIPALVDHFLRQLAEPDSEPRRASREVLARLSARAWAGNVRELRNEVARLCVLCSGDLDDPLQVSQPDLALTPQAPDRLVTLEELERDAILRALRLTGGDKNEAARRLGISRAKIYQRLKDWGAS